ncbi:Molybdopterin biosynthesis MoaE [Jimgerdemannia flammicorona]|uniref:Molybdopterin biosynthesis MoaE n=1 Tax=Jimgerdemannia flammicorona TaxID=994334 RepID=A0A433Q3V9_9FUNG|nr:Molybdopterin biosynthesis MoaE [Jimgerdemannia flammicorona]
MAVPHKPRGLYPTVTFSFLLAMSPDKSLVEITNDPLPPLNVFFDLVADVSAGAVSTFSGTTRDTFNGKQVLRLDYTAYAPMATKVLHDLITEARARWPLRHVAVHHRTGTVPAGQASVIIAVSSVHRREAMHATEYLIDELKRRCPIWKKEVYTDGSMWKENDRCC